MGALCRLTIDMSVDVSEEPSREEVEMANLKVRGQEIEDAPGDRVVQLTVVPGPVNKG